MSSNARFIEIPACAYRSGAQEKHTEFHMFNPLRIDEIHDPPGREGIVIQIHAGKFLCPGIQRADFRRALKALREHPNEDVITVMPVEGIRARIYNLRCTSRPLRN